MFSVITLALFMSSMLGTAIATALHTLQLDFGTSVSWAGWTITAYSLGLVIMLPISGKLADRYGRRRILVTSVAVFTLASMACGLAGNIYVLIVLRMLQAAGGAGFTPAATGLVVEHFGAARDRYLGMFSSIFPIGAMVGPVIGGVLVEWASWRWIFYSIVPVGAIMIPLCLKLIPPDAPRPAATSGAKADIAGSALLMGGLLAAMLTLSYLADTTVDAGAKPWVAVAGLAVAAALLAAFIRHIGRSDNPIIDPRLIYGQGFGAVNIMNIAYSGAVIGLVSLVPLYASTRFGIGVVGSGALLTAESIAAILITSLAVLLLRRTGYRLPIVAGALGIAAGMVMLWLAPVGAHSWVFLAGALVLSGGGTGMLSPASRNAGIQLAPRLAASIAAVRTTGFQVGTISVVSIATMAMASAADPGAVQSIIYGAFALVVIAVLPVATRVPEHKGAW